MNTKKHLIIGAVAVTIFMGALSPVRAQAINDSRTSSTMLRGLIFQRMAEKLNLSEDQKTQVKTVLSAEKTTIKNLLGQLHDARKNLRAAIQANDANVASVRAASAKTASVEADLAVERMELYGKISPILTDKQRQQISDFTQRADEFADNFIAQIGDGLAQ